MLRCGRCVKFFVVFGHWRGLWRKNKIWLGKKLGKKWLFCFFLLELLACHLITKTCKHLVHPSHFDAKKSHIFLNFLAILFQIYCSQACILTVFPHHELLECQNSTKICTHLAHMSIFDLTKFYIFLNFFAIFFRTVKAVWPDGNGVEGHFYKGT